MIDKIKLIHIIIGDLLLALPERRRIIYLPGSILNSIITGHQQANSCRPKDSEAYFRCVAVEK